MFRPVAVAAVLALAQPATAFVPVSCSLDGAIVEPNTDTPVRAQWLNEQPVTACMYYSTFQFFMGPPGPTYSILDFSGAYGCVAPLTSQWCVDCFAIRVTATSRPVQHWDAVVDESPTAPPWTSKQWYMHIGSTFSDVPPASPFYRFVETLVHNNVTGGCSTAEYCPAAGIRRDAMAVFIVKAASPANFVPPPCGALPRFSDVPVSSPFCPWVEELVRRGTVGGCGPDLYCPAQTVTREEMAVFLLAGNGYLPPACTSAPFGDVPASSPFCPWIQELVGRGVTAGCGSGDYCPGALVTREQMSVFLTTRFQLTISFP